MPVTLALVLATAFFLLAGWRRWQALAGTSDLEGLVLVGALGLSAIGVTATLLGIWGLFGAGPMALVMAPLGVLLWPWRRPWPPRRSSPQARADGNYGWVAVLVVLAALATRTPVSVELAAGRDQGSYVLIADALIRTGGFAHTPTGLERLTRLAQPPSHDVTLAPSSSGRALLDLLVPRSDDPNTHGLYEGRWRPGAYLVDRDRARVTAQFMRLNAALLATAQLLAGPTGVTLHVLALSLLAALALFATAARLLDSAPWGGVATLIFLTVPAAAWTARLPLSEGPTLLLTSAAALAATLGVQDEDPRFEHLAAFLLGMVAWTRGNGLLVAPVILVLLIWSARHLHAKGSPFTYAITVDAALLAHAWDAWPYLHDELRRLGVALSRPEELIVPWLVVTTILVAFGAARAWPRHMPALSRESSSPPGPARRLHVALLLASFVVVLVAIVWSLVPSPAPPYARLPLLARVVSPLVLVASAVALVDLARRRRWVEDVGPSRLPALDASPWLLALVGSALVSAFVFMVPALPSDQLPYYGRYFVPELLPLLALATAHAFRTLSLLAARRLGRDGPGRRRAAGTVAFALVASTLAYPAGPVFLSQDFRAGDQVALRATADELARSIPRDALVLVPQGLDLSRHAFNQIGGVLDLRHGATVLQIPEGHSTRDVLAILDAAHSVHAEFGPTEVALLVAPSWLPRDRGIHDPPAAATWPLEAPKGWTTDRAVRVEAVVERVAPSRTFDWPTRARSRVAFAVVLLRRLPEGAPEDPPLRATRRILVDVDGTRISDDFAPVTTSVVAIPQRTRRDEVDAPVVVGDWERWDTPPTHVVLTMDVPTSARHELELRLGDVVVATTAIPASAHGRWTSPPLRLELAGVPSATQKGTRTSVDVSAWRVRVRDASPDEPSPVLVSRIVWWRDAEPRTP